MAVLTVDPATGFYTPPYSLPVLSPHIHKGLAVIGSLACVSLVTTSVGLGMIIHRYVIWSKHAEKTSSYNQCIILLSNLLIADFFQAIAFSVSFRWYHLKGIFAPTNFCYAQAGFLQFGNVVSGSFVFAMALHTAYSVVNKRNVNPKIFRRTVVSIWFVAFLFTISGPLAHGSDFFARAGNWCWISEKYNVARLLLHYMWIFAFQFGTIIIYSGVYLYLRRNSRLAQSHMPLATKNSQIMKAARCMIAYPVVYMVGTLPIAVGRMMTLAGKPPSDRYLIFAGCMLTSCGWVDGLLYTITRNVFRDSDSERQRNASAVSTVDPLSTHKPSHSSTNSTAKRPKLMEWMRTMSTSSVRASLVQVDSVIDPISERPRQERYPSVDSTWNHTDMARTKSTGMSFTDFLNGLDDEDLERHLGEDVHMDTIPESPIRLHSDSRL